MEIRMRKEGINMSEHRPGFVVNFLIRALVGMAIIFFVNEFLSSKGINLHVGMNGVSFLTAGAFGIPGVALLYGVVVYQNL